MSVCTDLLSWVDEQQGLMVSTLEKWSEINSGSFNLAGLDVMLQELQAAFSVLNADMEVLDLPPMSSVDGRGETVEIALGRALRYTKRPTAPQQVFLAGHMDTVFAVDHDFQKCRYLQANVLNGPGVADLKGGLLVMLYALQALEQHPDAGNIGWQVLINPDEEIGSHGSAPLLEEAAKRHHLGLVFEPALADGTLAGSRKGSGNFTIITRGRAAHAGREHHKGRNAVVGLAAAITELAGLTNHQNGITVNPACIHGGGAVNVVPDLALCHFNIRVADDAQPGVVMQRLRDICGQTGAKTGLDLELHGGFTRPPKPMHPGNRKLYEKMRHCGRALGIDIRWQDTGGCCDGNNLSAAGLPNIDTLGVCGGAIHSDREYVLLDSLTERTRLSASFLMQLAGGQVFNPGGKAI